MFSELPDSAPPFLDIGDYGPIGEALNGQKGKQATESMRKINKSLCIAPTLFTVRWGGMARRSHSRLLQSMQLTPIRVNRDMASDIRLGQGLASNE